VYFPTPRGPTMPARIILRCPGCKARIKAPIELLGTNRTCPGCHTWFVVRNQPIEDSGPLLAAARAGATDEPQRASHRT
jgi:hypothetical protein